jgi:hypothetical protein
VETVDYTELDTATIAQLRQDRREAQGTIYVIVLSQDESEASEC